MAAVTMSRNGVTVLGMHSTSTIVLTCGTRAHTIVYMCLLTPAGMYVDHSPSHSDLSSTNSVYMKLHLEASLLLYIYI